MHTNTTVALKPTFMSSLLLCADFKKICNMHIPESPLEFKIFIIKIPKDSLFLFLVLNAV